MAYTIRSNISQWQSSNRRHVPNVRCENAKKKKNAFSDFWPTAKKKSKRGAQMCFISNFRSSMSWAERTHPKTNHAMNSFLSHDATPKISLGFHKLSLIEGIAVIPSSPFGSVHRKLPPGQMKKEVVPRRKKKVLYYCCYSISFVSENVWSTEIMVFKKRPQTCIQNWISILNALHTLTNTSTKTFSIPCSKAHRSLQRIHLRQQKSHLRWAYLQNFRVFAFTFNLFASHSFQTPPFFKAKYETLVDSRFGSDL